MFCTNCGKALDDDMRFCIYCGTPVMQSGRSVEDAPLTETVSAAAEQGNPDYSFGAADHNQSEAAFGATGSDPSEASSTGAGPDQSEAVFAAGPERNDTAFPAVESDRIEASSANVEEPFDGDALSIPLPDSSEAPSASSRESQTAVVNDASADSNTSSKVVEVSMESKTHIEDSGAFDARMPDTDPESPAAYDTPASGIQTDGAFDAAEASSIAVDMAEGSSREQPQDNINRDAEMAMSFLYDDSGQAAVPRVSLRRKSNGRVYPVTDLPSKIGKGSAADVIIEGNSSVSRVHASLDFDGADLYITDEGSLNGTLLNGIAVETGDQAVLNNGDILVLANEEFFIIVE